MPLLLWDASALSQRYAPETGSATVDALLRDIPAARHIVSVLAYAETCSVLLRKLNRGDIGIRTYRAARGMLRREAAEGREFVPLSIDDAAVFS